MRAIYSLFPLLGQTHHIRCDQNPTLHTSIRNFASEQIQEVLKWLLFFTLRHMNLFFNKQHCQILSDYGLQC